MRQGELIRWYVDQQNQKNSYSSLEEAKNEASKIKAIIEVKLKISESRQYILEVLCE
jgi:macrodomain Ter protein organizer (MatP/YcbG family)